MKIVGIRSETKHRVPMDLLKPDPAAMADGS